MQASDFLKVVTYLISLGALFVLGYFFVSYLLGYWDLPIGAWTPGHVFNVIIWLVLLAYGILIIFTVLLWAITRAVGKRDQHAGTDLPSY